MPRTTCPRHSVPRTDAISRRRTHSGENDAVAMSDEVRKNVAGARFSVDHLPAMAQLEGGFVKPERTELEDRHRSNSVGIQSGSATDAVAQILELAELVAREAAPVPELHELIAALAQLVLARVAAARVEVVAVA